MKTKKLLGCLAALAMTFHVSAQNWLTNGNPVNGTEWFGADASSTVPLRIETRANQPIDWYTNAIQRLRLNQSTTYTVGAFTGQVADGYIGLSPDNSLWTSGPGPFSRLHLHGGGAPYQFSYRPWMDNGLAITTNLDQMYIGHKIEPGVETAAVVQWGDNSVPPFGPDVLKFIYTDNYVSGTYGPNALNGRELGRFHPLGRFGLGDFQAVGLQPTERLDVLAGRVRIRTLPADPQDLTSTKMLVVDDVNPSSPEYGVVKWRDINSLMATDCDWEVTSVANVVTAHLASPASGCPGQYQNVGIGNSSPNAKLDIVKVSQTPGGFEVGVNVRMGTSGATNFGGIATTSISNATTNTGWQGIALNGGRQYGLDGIAAWTSTVNSPLWPGGRIHGVRGFADGEFQTQAQFIRGVYGCGISDQAGGPGYGGWFDGLAFCSLGIWSPSDENLKDNVTDLSSATTMIAQLQPKSYTYRSADYPSMVLDDRTHFGLIAQELQQVFPELVRQSGQGAVLDSLGNVIVPELDFLTVNYEGLIPWLIAAFNEQTLAIEVQEQRVIQLEHLLASCCAMHDDVVAPRSMEQGNTSSEFGQTASDERLTIAPNPFQEQTTISYVLEGGARVQLQVSSQSGLHIATLRDQQQEEGAYSLTWHTADLAPGTYIVTLYADGAPVVKRAVKVK